MRKYLFLIVVTILSVIGCEKNKESFDVYGKWVSTTDGYNYILDIREDNQNPQAGAFAIDGKNITWTTASKEVHQFEINSVEEDRMTLTEYFYVYSNPEVKINFRKEQ